MAFWLDHTIGQSTTAISSDNTLYIGGSSNYDNGNYGVYTGFNDHGNIHWFDTPQPEDDYDGYDTGNNGGFYGEPDSEGFPEDSNSFGPTTPSAYIDPVQEMIYQDYRRYQNNREFDGIQRTLDAAGLVPVFGIAADLVNAGISAARGNWKDAAMSLGAAVPVAGMAFGLYRLGKGGLKGAKGASSVGQRIAGGHSFYKHLLNKGEFVGLGIRTRSQASQFIDNILKTSKGSNVRQLMRGRTGYWDPSTGTVVIKNPNAADFGTFFRPHQGRHYFDNILK